MPIGVFDSGLGGLTVLRALVDRLPTQPFVYFGDNANAPYGTRDPESIYRLTCAGVETLFAQGCQMVLLACNTASAVALRRLQREWLPLRGAERRVLGVFVPVIEHLTGVVWQAEPHPVAPAAVVGHIALFATPATVASGAFAREVTRRAPWLQVHSMACAGLVDALEAGQQARAEQITAACVARLLEQMAGQLPQAAVLGCTHYPLVEAAFRAALPAETQVISQPALVAESLAAWLSRHPEYAEETTPPALPHCLTSGDVNAVSRLASQFFGRELAFSSAGSFRPWCPAAC